MLFHIQAEWNKTQHEMVDEHSLQLSEERKRAGMTEFGFIIGTWEKLRMEHYFMMMRLNFHVWHKMQYIYHLSPPKRDIYLKGAVASGPSSVEENLGEFKHAFGLDDEGDQKEATRTEIIWMNQVQALKGSVASLTLERDNLQQSLETARKELLLQESSKETDLGSPVSSGDMTVEELELLLETTRHAAQLEISRWKDKAEGGKKALLYVFLILWSLAVVRWLYEHWRYGRVLN